MIREERKNMYDINYEKVMALFLRLSGIDDNDRNKYDDIVENACGYVARHIKEPQMVVDVDRVLFASAAVAVYDNTLFKLINDKSLCTADGRAVESYKDADAYKYAKKLREHAVACVSDIWIDDDFSFAAVEG